MKSQANSGLVSDERGVVIFYPFALTVKKATKKKLLALIERVSKNLMEQSNLNFSGKGFLICQNSQIADRCDCEYQDKDINVWFVRRDDMQNMHCTVSAYVLPITTTGSPRTFEQSAMCAHIKLSNRKLGGVHV